MSEFGERLPKVYYRVEVSGVKNGRFGYFKKRTFAQLDHAKNCVEMHRKTGAKAKLWMTHTDWQEIEV